VARGHPVSGVAWTPNREILKTGVIGTLRVLTVITRMRVLLESIEYGIAITKFNEFLYIEDQLLGAKIALKL
jgi:hypothetical protein